MNESQRVQFWLNLARSHPGIQQFGDGHNVSTGGGKRGCTQTILRFLALGWTGKLYTQDDVSRMAGYPTSQQAARGTGMTAAQCEQFIRAAKLPYRIVPFNHTEGYFGLMRRANLHGPIAIGVAYSHQPQWKGYSYHGVRALGVPNGFASPLGKAGKTQLTGFTGSHMDALLGYMFGGRDRHRVCFVKDPNHGSAIRPERPPYDAMTQAQFEKLYESFQTALGRSLYAIVPTEVFNR